MLAGCRLLLRIEIDEPNNATVRLTEYHRQLSEIFVERDQYPRFVPRDIQNFLIAGIGIPVPGPDHVVPSRCERLTRAIF